MTCESQKMRKKQLLVEKWSKSVGASTTNIVNNVSLGRFF